MHLSHASKDPMCLSDQVQMGGTQTVLQYIFNIFETEMSSV